MPPSLPSFNDLRALAGLTADEALLLAEYHRRGTDAGTCTEEDSACVASLRDLARSTDIGVTELREAHHGLAERGICAPLDHRLLPSSPQLLAFRSSVVAGLIAHRRAADRELNEAEVLSRGARAEWSLDGADPFA